MIGSSVGPAFAGLDHKIGELFNKMRKTSLKCREFIEEGEGLERG